MMRRSAVFNARIVYSGVALASGGIAFYTPLMLAAVGLQYSGTWAAAILCGVNLGRLLGARLASRHAVFTRRSAAIVANILLEGVALFSMAFLAQPWMLVTAATVAGLGSGLSFSGMKNALLRIPGLDPARAFAGLSVAFRVGMSGGYLAGALVGGAHLTLVFGVLLLLFVAYAGAMHVALADIAAGERLAAATPAPMVPVASSVAAAPAAATGLPRLLVATLAFWFLTVQPTVTLSLYVPRFVPGLPVSATYWVLTVTVLLLQMRVTAFARDRRDHLRFLRIGTACLLAGFVAMCLAAGSIALVLAATLLLALSQVFFCPSIDVLVAGAARAGGLDTGRTLARQHFWQNLGMTAGSLAAGAVFDLSLRWGVPWLAWAAGAVGALLMLVGWGVGERRSEPVARVA